MSEQTDVRSTRLLWIRDGSNWLVGLSAGALVLSGTYFYDRFGAAPHGKAVLISAWIFLTICVLFGVLTSFAAWKDLREPTSLILIGASKERRLGPWVAHSYTIMMWTFLIGYLALAASLITNVLYKEKAAPTGRLELRVPCVGGSVTIVATNASLNTREPATTTRTTTPHAAEPAKSSPPHKR